MEHRNLLPSRAQGDKEHTQTKLPSCQIHAEVDTSRPAGRWEMIWSSSILTDSSGMGQRILEQQSLLPPSRAQGARRPPDKQQLLVPLTKIKKHTKLRLPPRRAQRGWEKRRERSHLGGLVPTSRELPYSGNDQ